MLDGRPVWHRNQSCGEGTDSQEPWAVCMPGSADSLRKLGSVGKEMLATWLGQGMVAGHGGGRLELCAVWGTGIDLMVPISAQDALRVGPWP